MGVGYTKEQAIGCHSIELLYRLETRRDHSSELAPYRLWFKSIKQEFNNQVIHKHFTERKKTAAAKPGKVASPQNRTAEEVNRGYSSGSL